MPEFVYPTTATVGISLRRRSFFSISLWSFNLSRAFLSCTSRLCKELFHMQKKSGFPLFWSDKTLGFLVNFQIFFTFFKVTSKLFWSKIHKLSQIHLNQKLTFSMIFPIRKKTYFLAYFRNLEGSVFFKTLRQEARSWILQVHLLFPGFIPNFSGFLSKVTKFQDFSRFSHRSRFSRLSGTLKN